MKAVNLKAQKVMGDLIAEMDGDRHKRFNEGGSFMPLVVEHIGDVEFGPMYSFAHYYTQNGDPMRDPEMTFVFADGKFYPVSFQQDGGLPVYQVSAGFCDGKLEWQRPKWQRDQATFAGVWMLNFKDQREMTDRVLAAEKATADAAAN